MTRTQLFFKDSFIPCWISISPVPFLAMEQRWYQTADVLQFYLFPSSFISYMSGQKETPLPQILVHVFLNQRSHFLITSRRDKRLSLEPNSTPKCIQASRTSQDNNFWFFSIFLILSLYFQLLQTMDSFPQLFIPIEPWHFSHVCSLLSSSLGPLFLGFLCLNPLCLPPLLPFLVLSFLMIKFCLLVTFSVLLPLSTLESSRCLWLYLPHIYNIYLRFNRTLELQCLLFIYLVPKLCWHSRSAASLGAEDGI